MKYLVESFPSTWRKATVIPISKPGMDPLNPNNYHPIALTSCLCKIMERMVNSRLVWYLEVNEILIKFHAGFRGKKEVPMISSCTFKASFVMPSSIKTTWCQFSLILKRHTTPRGNMVCKRHARIRTTSFC